MDIRPKLKGVFVLDDGVPVPFMYNPAEITETRKVNYKKTQPKAVSHPRLHYQYGEGFEQSWSMSVRNVMDIGGVRLPFNVDLYIATITDLTYPVFNDTMMTKAPPTVMMVFAEFVRFVKITEIVAVRKEYNQFLIPKAATVTIKTIDDADATSILGVFGSQRINETNLSITGALGIV